jgi:hypothetical protein
MIMRQIAAFPALPDFSYTPNIAWSSPGAVHLDPERCGKTSKTLAP